MNHTDLVLATKALYNWLLVRKRNTDQVKVLMSGEYTQGYNQGGNNAYVKVLNRMRTLFAGLIELEEKQEKTEHGLRQVVRGCEKGR